MMTVGRSNLAELAELVGAQLIGDLNARVNHVASLQDATSEAITFYTNVRYRDKLKSTQAGAVILHQDHSRDCPTAALVVSNPYYAYATIAAFLHPRQTAESGVHPSAVLGEGVQLGSRVHIGAHSVVESGACIEDGVEVGSGCFIGSGARVGAESMIANGVSIGAWCVIGARAVLHPGAVIGADGFGFAPGADGWRKVPQLGCVRIGDDVEIGANSTIDRGTLQDTVIGEGVKIDNLVHIGHNASIGARTVIAGCTVVAGSATIGENCVIAGAVAINGHVELADGVTVLGMTGVAGNLNQAGVYSSPIPAQPVKKWRRNAVRFTQLDEVFQRVKHLERELDTLKGISQPRPFDRGSSSRPSPNA